MYAVEKDDLMIDQLLMLPPVRLPVGVLCLGGPTHLLPSLSLTLFNKINIAHAATYCPLAAGAIKRSPRLHLFINESGLCLPCIHFTLQDQVVYD